MPKICEYDGCTNPIWSRKTMRCKMHLSSQPATPNKTKLKKVTQKIKQFSSKRQRQNQAYLIMRKIFLETYEHCAVFPNLQATEIHHAYGRRGEMLLDTRYWFAVSREGHSHIHSNVEWAEENGYLIKGRNSI
jgi:hypothetical protein